MTCEELDDLAGAIALGAALPGETAAAYAHMAACQRGHRDVLEFMAVAMLLPESLQPSPPDPALRDRILEAARADHRTLPPMPQPAESSISKQHLPRSPLVPLFASLAAALLIVALGLGWWMGQLNAELQQQRAQIALQQQALAALAAGGEFVAFRGGAAAGAIHGGIVRPPAGQPILVLAGLSPQPQGVYQLWMIHNGVNQDMGVLQPGPDGRYTAALPDISAAEALTVTAEPHRVAQPTTEPILTATLVPNESALALQRIG